MTASTASPDPLEIAARGASVAVAGARPLLDALAAASPVPAGGAAAAFAVAMAASLCAMAARLSGLEDSAERTRRLAQLATDLAAEDGDAYAAVLLAARRRGGPDEAQRAWERATLVPIGVAETAADVIEETRRIRESLRRSLACDAGAAALLAAAGGRASLANAAENLGRISDRRTRDALDARLRAARSRLAGADGEGR